MKVPATVSLAAALLSVGMLAAGQRGMASKSSDPLAVAAPGPGGATDLALAPGLSFTDDSSGNFPIRGENLGDGKIATDRPTAIFFGTSHCWNTNREAERFVKLYQKHKDVARFLVVDLNAPSSQQRPLVSRFYAGYIPTLAFLDRKGDVIYNRSGETARERRDISALEEILKRRGRIPSTDFLPALLRVQARRTARNRQSSAKITLPMPFPTHPNTPKPQSPQAFSAFRDRN